MVTHAPGTLQRDGGECPAHGGQEALAVLQRRVRETAVAVASVEVTDPPAIVAAEQQGLLSLPVPANSTTGVKRND